MTCAIAHVHGWMVADRMTVSGNSTGPYEVSKVKKGIGLLLTYAGDVVIGNYIEDALNGPDAWNDLVRMMRNPANDLKGVVLGLNSGGIYEVCCAGSVLRLSSEYWAIGSGDHAALGYLAGLGKRTITPEDAVAAIGFASTLCVGVGSDCQIERL